MKNIYEDNQHDGEIKRPSFDFEAPLEGFGSKPKQEPKPADKEDQGTQPVVQLTAQQLSDILSLISANGEGEKQPKAEEEPIYAKEEKAPAPATDPGKKILYQSDDFDSQPTSSRKLPPIKSSVSAPQESGTQPQIHKPHYAKPVISHGAQTERPTSPPTVSHSRPTDYGKKFSVSEVETEGGKAQNNVDSRKPQIIKSTSHQGSSLSFGAGADDMTEQTAARTAPKVDVKEVDLPHDGDDGENKAKKKKRSKGDIVRLVVLIVSLVAILVSGSYLIREYVLHRQNQKLEENFSNLIIEDETTAEEETTKNKKDDKKPTEKKEEKTTLSKEQKWANMKAQYPNIAFPPNMQLKYAKLYATNTDFVGYLDVPGVNLSLPVVQTADNETYLGKNFYGASTKYGCPFVACENNILQFDMNTVIYGHHMNDGTIFGALDKYKTIDGFKAAPVIEFNTLYGNYKWKVIAAFITNAEQEDDGGYVFNYFFANLNTKEHFASYLNEIAQRSLYDTGVDVNSYDKLLTLSTCSHEFDNARFVVVARLVREGESADVDTTLAAENANPRYPQAYYSKKSLTNPYAYASRWYPNV